MKSKLRHSIASVLIVSVFSMGLPAPAQAGIVGTKAAADRVRIVAALDREEVRTRLVAYGVGLPEAKTRVAALTDEEATRLAAELDALPAGGDPIMVTVAAYVVVLCVALIVGAVAMTLRLFGMAIDAPRATDNAPTDASHPTGDPAPKLAQR